MASHKRDTNARRPRAFRAGAPAAITATVVAVGVGLGGTTASMVAAPAVDEITRQPVAEVFVPPEVREMAEERSAALSRSATGRISKVDTLLSATPQAVKRATAVRWTTEVMRRWTRPDADGVQRGTMPQGTRVTSTGRSFNGRVEVVQGTTVWWITAGYLTDAEPVVAAAGLSMASCPNPSVESGLTAAAVYVYRSVCHAFPQITSYGGWDNHGEHASGRAIDIMTSDVELGTAISEFLRANAAELNLYDVIWRQHIYMPMRAADGWRWMASRGSATANHYDHVHVAVY
ncbi:hypothetical protein BH09ACT11_BH09ACT11_11230 [soil metagenome]